MRRSTTVMAAPLAGLLTLLLAGQALATTWFPAVTLATDAETQPSGRAAVTLGADTVVVAYLQHGGSNHGVYVRRSGDSGATWEAPLQIASAASSSIPEISGRDTSVDIVWQANGRVRYARSIDSGATFLPTLTLGAASGDGDSVRVGRGPSGRVAVAWERCSPGKSVRVRVSVDSGASFGAVHPIVADCGEFKHGVNVAVGTGVIYVSYRDLPTETEGIPGYTRLKMVRSLDDGATWMAPVTLANHTHAYPGTSIAAEGAEAYITYVTDSLGFNQFGRYRRTMDQGASWTAPASLAPRTGPPILSPVVSLDGGVVRAAYASGNGSDFFYDLFYRESADGTSWTAPQKIATNIDWVSGIGFAGRIVVLYQKFTVDGDIEHSDLRVRTGTP